MADYLGWWGGTVEHYNELQNKRFLLQVKDNLRFYKNLLTPWQRVGYYWLLLKYKVIKLFKKNSGA